MKLTLLLGNPKMRAIGRWQNLGRQFFHHHRKDILGWCEYDNLVEKINPVPVKETDVLIDVFSGMKKAGVLGGCSFMQLALCMLSFFCIDLEASTLCALLTAADGYSFKKIWYDYWGKKYPKPNKK